LRVVFLDRDGVINHCADYYVKSVAEIRLYPYAARSIRALNDAGFEVIVVSNQSGIARGVYTPEDLDVITGEIQRRLTSGGARILDSFFCPHDDNDGCDCRKPRPGLMLNAKAKYPDIDMSASFLVGDSLRDIQAGNSAGVRTVLVLTGHGGRDFESAMALDAPPIAATEDLWTAVGVILDFA